MNIRCVVAIEEHQQSAVVVTPSSIQLYQHAMSLCSRDEVVVYANCLTGQQFVGGKIDLVRELDVECRLNKGLDERERLRIANRLDRIGKINVAQIELVLLVKVSLN